MNKDLKKTLLFSVIVFLFSSFVIYEINVLKNEKDKLEEKTKVVDLETHKIQTVVLGDKGQVEKNNNHYLIKSEGLNDLLNTESVESWLSKALSQEGRRLSTEGEKVEWRKFKFTKADPKISLFTEQRAIDISLSSMRSFDGGVYLKVEDNKNKHLYSSNEKWVNFFTKTVKSLRETKLFDWTAIDPESKIKQIKVKTNNNAYALKKEQNTWKPGSEEISGWLIDTAKVNSFLSDVKIFLIEDFTDVSLETSKDPEYRLTIETESENSPYVLNVYSHNNKKYATVSYRPEVTLEVSDENIRSLFPDAVDFKDFKTDLSIDEPKVQKLKVEKDKINLNFYKDKEDNSWRLTDANIRDNVESPDFNSSSILKVIDTLKDLKPERYLNENPKRTGRAEASYTFLDENNQVVKGLKLFPDKAECIKGESKSLDCKLIQVDKSFLVVKENEISKLTNIDYFTKANEKSSVE